MRDVWGLWTISPKASWPKSLKPSSRSDRVNGREEGHCPDNPGQSCEGKLGKTESRTRQRARLVKGTRKSPTTRSDSPGKSTVDAPRPPPPPTPTPTPGRPFLSIRARKTRRTWIPTPEFGIQREQHGAERGVEHRTLSSPMGMFSLSHGGKKRLKEWGWRAVRARPFRLFLDAGRAADDAAMTFRDLYLARNELRPKISTIWRRDRLESASRGYASPLLTFSSCRVSKAIIGEAAIDDWQIRKSRFYFATCHLRLSRMRHFQGRLKSHAFRCLWLCIVYPSFWMERRKSIIVVKMIFACIRIPNALPVFNVGSRHCC